MLSFGDRLKMLRKNIGLTQKQLAIDLGASERGIQQYELGERKPTYDMLITIADYFEVPTDFLFGRGIFENWDLIIKNKEDIVDAMISEFESENIIVMPKSYIMALPDNVFMRMLQSNVQYIHFTKIGDKIDFGLELYPLNVLFPEAYPDEND